MLHLVEHPLIAEELTKLRDPACPSPEFRQGFRRIASLMVPAVTANLETTVVPCNTPLEITSGVKVTRELILVPILRAGLGFLDGFLDLLPQASVEHIGIARNERTRIQEPYSLKHTPVMAENEIIILDPMLATGGSAIETVRSLREVGARHIRFVCLVAVPEGVTALEEAYPDLSIYAACLDRCLDNFGYILPGLGDAGDRLFGTSV